MWEAESLVSAGKNLQCEEPASSRLGSACAPVVGVSVKYMRVEGGETRESSSRQWVSGGLDFPLRVVPARQAG